MTTTLSEGVKVPDVGSVNWAGDLEVNWNLLNGALANLSGNVKLDRDNTWTGEQSFTLPIVGSITGTASKAIADEDGTSIKTGYVNVAGNQTVTGQKTWSAENTYTNTLLTQKQTGLETGVTPATNQTRRYRFTDKNNVDLGWVQHRVNTSGESYIELYAVNKFDNSQLSPQGTAVANSFTIGLKGDGTRFSSIMSDLYPAATNTYKLGTSTNQWSSVYAQSYYYNGTEFQSKFVTTDTEQVVTANKGIATYNATFALHNTQIELGTAPAYQRNSEIFFGDKNYAELGRVLYRAYTNGTRQMWIAINDKYSNGALSPAGTNKWNNLFINIDPTGHRNVAFDTDDVIPNTNNINLGTSTNQWKTLNGINPGALSLPDYSNVVNLDTTNWSKTGDMIVYTPTFDGWLQITIPNDDDGNGVKNNMISILDSGTSPLTGFSVSNLLGPRLYLLYPVIANRVYWLYVKSYSGTITVARLVKCLGNV